MKLFAVLCSMLVVFFVSTDFAMRSSTEGSQQSTSSNDVAHSVVIMVSQAQESTPSYGEVWLRYGQYCQNVRVQSTSAENSQQTQNSHCLGLPSDETWSYAERQRQAEQQAVVRSSEQRNPRIFSTQQIVAKLLASVTRLVEQKESLPSNRLATLSSGSWHAISSEPRG